MSLWRTHSNITWRRPEDVLLHTTQKEKNELFLTGTDCQSFSLSLSQECQEGCYPSNPRIVQHSEQAKMQHDVWPSLWSLLKDQTSPRQSSGVFCNLAVQQMCPHCAPENLDQASNRLKCLSGFVSQIHKVHNKRSKTANITSIGRANRPRRSYQ